MSEFEQFSHSGVQNRTETEVIHQMPNFRKLNSSLKVHTQNKALFFLLGDTTLVPPLHIRQLFTLFLLLLSTNSLTAQKVKWRDGLVAFDGKPYLAYEIHRGGGHSVYVYGDLGWDQELFQAHFCENRSRSGSDDYRHYYFPDADLEMILPRKRKYSFKFLLPKMVAEGVLDEEGQLNETALRKFVAKYHVPLPKSFGTWKHQLPVVDQETGDVHRWNK